LACDDLAEPIVDAGARHEPHQESQGEAHHGEVVTIDACDDRRAEPLDAVRASLVHRLAGGDVARDVRRGQLAKRDVYRFDIRHDDAVARDGDRGKHQVLARRKPAQHGGRLGFVAGLAKDVAVHDHDGVRGDDDRVRLALGDRARLASRQALRVRPRLLSVKRRLVDVRRRHGVCDADQR